MSHGEHSEEYSKNLQKCFQQPAPQSTSPLHHSKTCLLPNVDLPLSLFICVCCELLFFSLVIVISLLFMKAEETKFQQASNGNPEWIFLFPSQQPLPQWGSQRGVSQEVRHHSVPGKTSSEDSAQSLAVVVLQGRVLEAWLSWTFMPYKFHQLKPSNSKVSSWCV